jgi:hypothetical protein
MPYVFVTGLATDELACDYLNDGDWTAITTIYQLKSEGVLSSAGGPSTASIRAICGTTGLVGPSEETIAAASGNEATVAVYEIEPAPPSSGADQSIVFGAR